MLYNLSRFDEAVARAGEVVALRERTGDPATLGQALLAVADALHGERPGRFRAGRDPRRCPAGPARRPAGAGPRLHLPGRHHEAHRPPRRGHRPGPPGPGAGQPASEDVVAHSLNYLGAALLDLGDPGGAAHLRRSAEVARSAARHEYTQRAYTNLVEGLYRQGRFRELDHPLAEGLAYAREYGFASHEYNLEAHRCMLLTLRGRWDEAEAELRTPLAGEDGVLASSGCRRWAGCWPARATRPPGPCWSGPGAPPPGPTRSRRSPWPGSPGWSRPCWPVTTGPAAELARV